jgi:hypothetical protein
MTNHIGHLIEFVGYGESRQLSVSKFYDEWCVVVKVGVMIFHASGDDKNEVAGRLCEQLRIACMVDFRHRDFAEIPCGSDPTGVSGQTEKAD